MKAKPALTTCTVTARAVMDTYLARVEENDITATHADGIGEAASKAAGHALRVAPEHVVLSPIPCKQRNCVRFTATVASAESVRPASRLSPLASSLPQP